MATYAHHHVWCNDNNGGQAVNCRMCDSLYRNYPHDPEARSLADATKLTRKHFPNVTIISPEVS